MHVLFEALKNIYKNSSLRAITGKRTGVVGHGGRGVEELVYPVAAVGPHHTVVLRLGVLLDDRTSVSVLHTGAN